MDTMITPAQKPMTTQEVIDLITPIPEDQFCVNDYCTTVNDKECCCVMGFVNKASTGDPYSSIENNYYSDGLRARGLRARSNDFLGKRGYRYDDITNVNNGITNLYPQPTPKQRVLALLNDMLAAGY